MSGIKVTKTPRKKKGPNIAALSSKILNPADLKPKTNDKHIGVEMEITVPYPQQREHDPYNPYYYLNDRTPLAKALAIAGLAGYVQMTTDGSINPTGNMFGVELRVIAPENEIYDIIKRTCKVLKDMKCKVNSSCGLHVHLDMRSRVPEDSFKRLVDKLPELKKMVKKYRLKNEYCVQNYCNDLKLINGDESRYDSYEMEDDIYDIENTNNITKAQKKIAETIEKFKNRLEIAIKVKETDRDRYLAINPHSLREHKTIEVRLHEGSIEEDKINKWIETLITIADDKKVG